MSRVSREQAAENRARVVAVASALFRRQGIENVGIDELMSEAGLTRGGFYGQFGSKDDLAGEACAHAFEGAERIWNGLDASDGAGRLQRLAEFYFAPKPAGGECPMATLGGDAARAPSGGPLRRAFTDGLRRLARVLTGERADDRPLALLAAMVGAAMLRRASEDTDLADAIDAAVLRLAAEADRAP